MSVCSIESCDRPAKARGWCKRHWQRWSRTGSTAEPVRQSYVTRFWSRVDRRGPDECWPWLGYIGTRGYGVLKVKGQLRGAHRISFELHHGEIPDGHVAGHLCHDRDLDCDGGVNCAHRRCVNPAHLAAMSVGENVRAGCRGRDPESLDPPGVRIVVRRVVA